MVSMVVVAVATVAVGVGGEVDSGIVIAAAVVTTTGGGGSRGDDGGATMPMMTSINTSWRDVTELSNI